MIVAGIDPNKTKLALALLDTQSEQLRVHTFRTEVSARWEQLNDLAVNAKELCADADVVYVEEPVIGRSIRSSLHVAISAGAAVSALGMPAHFVPVTTWKKSVVGRGNADKIGVSAWLNTNHVTYAALCDGDQDLIDATCIALYGVGVQELAAGLLTH
jgi:Holliday junction resolvasome RuvABC endonuclease subunit